MNILQICQEAASLVATQKPLDLFNQDSQQEAIFLSIIKDTLESLRRYDDWQELERDGRLNVISGKSSYYISDFCPDFFSLINDTVYIKDSSEKMIGAITPAQWKYDQCFNISNLDLKFRIQSNCFKFLSEPKSFFKVEFKYRSSAIVYDKIYGSEEKDTVTKNTDIPLFDAHLVKMGVVYRWYKRNGMPYEEEFNEYEREVKKQFGASLATTDINLSGYHISEDEVTINVKTN